MSDPSRVTAIVVAYEGGALLPRSLASLVAEPLVDRIIVVDNGSTDDSCEVARQFARTEVIALERNCGFGRAHNVVFARLLPQPPEFILLLNQDAWLLPGCIPTLLATAVREPVFGILSPLHLTADETQIEARFATYLQKNPAATTAPAIRVGDVDSALKPVIVPFVNAAIWLMRGSLLATIGGFDPVFPHYGEDNDYCDRVQLHGSRVGVDTSARAVHARIATAPRQRRSLGQRLADAGNRQFVRWAIPLRDSRRVFAWQIACWLWDVPVVGWQAVWQASLFDLVAWIVAVLRTVVMLPIIIRRRRTVRTPGPHFLATS